MSIIRKILVAVRKDKEYTYPKSNLQLLDASEKKKKISEMHVDLPKERCHLGAMPPAQYVPCISMQAFSLPRNLCLIDLES